MVAAEAPRPGEIVTRGFQRGIRCPADPLQARLLSYRRAAPSPWHTPEAMELEIVQSPLTTLIRRWKADPGGAYRTWFLWEQRLKNFRSIRRGIDEVVREIDTGTFGSPYKASLLEPFNTVIVKGYNALTGAMVKLGKWDEFLAMRRGILALNMANRDELSNDLGAIGGLLFDIGTERYAAPPLSDDADAIEKWRGALEKVREALPRASAQA